MDQLLNLLIHYCQLTNIDLIPKNNVIDLHDIFIQAIDKGYLNKESYQHLLHSLEVVLNEN